MKMSSLQCYLIWCHLFLTSCASDLFHVGSEVTFHPNYAAEYFGYAVAFSENELIVGAPKATIQGPTPITAGVVFNCTLQRLETRNVSCTPLNMETRGFQNGMWFGASLGVGPTGKIVICAPRCVGGSTINETASSMNIPGCCYLRTERFVNVLSPFIRHDKQAFDINNSRADYFGYHLNRKKTSIKYYELGQAGMSLKVTENTVIIGAPGLLVWAGGIVQYAYDPDEKSIKYSTKPTYNPYFTSDVHPDDYFGYSVESGVFEDGGKTLYVAGGPKGRQGFGMVLVFEPATSEEAPLNILAKLEGPQLGAYFGASLTCVDINADGRTDLLVGAPNYVKRFPEDDVYEQGAVFVYLNKKQATGFILDYASRLSGSEANGAKFGYSIADLGDIDGDGYKDVAVSAPWEKHGTGAVYIYGGCKNGLKDKYMQRIVAGEARGFGMALARGHDVDHNNCNDLAVGAYDSGTAYIFRCLPTVKVDALILIPADLPQNTTNFTASFCVEVQQLRVYTTEVVMEFKAEVTVDPVYKRATIAGNSVHTYKMSAKSPYSSDSCDSKIIKIKPGADLSMPIPITFKVVTINRMQDDPTNFLPNAGRVSEDSKLHNILNFQLIKECGKDLICRPSLIMTLEAINDPYIPGSDGRLGAFVKVMNEEEPAFGIHVNMTLPSLPKRVPTTCRLQDLVLTCDLPYPLNQNETYMWDLEFEYTEDMRETGMAFTEAVIYVVPEKPIVLDTQSLDINIKPEANINATGKALPNATVSVSRDKFHAGDDARIPFVHYFQIANAGPSDWPELTATIIVSGKGSLILKEIAGCVPNRRDKSNLTLACSWSVNAKQSLPVVLSLRYDLTTNGKYLEADGTCNITSSLFLDEQNMKLSLTTVLVLEPAPLLLIPITIAIIVGLLLLGIFSYTLYKMGFFSSTHSQLPEALHHVALLEEPGCSSSYSPHDPSAADASKYLQDSNCSSNAQVSSPTLSNTSFDPLELVNNLPPFTFQSPRESEQNPELVCHSEDEVTTL